MATKCKKGLSNKIARRLVTNNLYTEDYQCELVRIVVSTCADACVQINA